MSTGLIIVIIVVVVILAALLVALPRIRAGARARAEQRELSRRRDRAVTEHREEADTRAQRADAAERQARIAEAEAQRERAEADMHRERAALHEEGLADHELTDDRGEGGVVGERERVAERDQGPGGAVQGDAPEGRQRT